MASVYYTIPGQATALNDEPANVPLLAPWVVSTYTNYLFELVENIAVFNPEPYGLVLKFSRSQNRTNPGLLDDGVLDLGKTYAIFLPDVPDFAYSQVDFKLDGVLVQTELSAPWDYAGTGGGGEAVVTTIPVGLHTIDAVVTYPGGTFTVSADLEVN